MYNQKIGKLKNLKVFFSKKIKGAKQDNLAKVTHEKGWRTLVLIELQLVIYNFIIRLMQAH
jgi:hypothetical protein